MKKEIESISKVFMKYVTLSVLGMIGLSCYILADTFFVSKGLGINGLTALNLAIPVYSFINGLGLMIGMGGSTQYSLLKVEEDREKGNHIFTQSVMFVFIISAILIVVGIFGVSTLTLLLGADSEVFNDTKIYLRIILIFAPMFMLNNTLICFVRNDGNPKLSMIAMLAGSFSNIILDYVFIFILKLGMFGAVFATALAPVISIIILSFHFIKKNNTFKLVWAKPTIKSIFNISSLGISFLITEVSAGIVIIIFNIIILSLKGNIGVAAYGVIANLSLVATAIFTGIAQGIQPMISQAYGEKEFNLVDKIYRYSLTTAFIVALCIYTIVFFFAEPIASVFNKEQSVEFLQISSAGMRIYFTAFIFVGFNIVTSVRFNSVGNSKKSFIVSILRGFIFIIPLAFILANLFHMTGIWLAFPIAELLTASVCLIMLLQNTPKRGIYMFREMRRKKQALSTEEIINVLNNGTSGVLAVQGDNDYPYAVPLSYVYDDSKIFFHCAQSGYKLDAIERNNKVSFCIIEQDNIIPEEYTTYFRSVVVFGKTRILKDEQEKRISLEKLAAKYSPNHEQGRLIEIDKLFKQVCMIELTIEHMTGKEAIELHKKR